MIAIYFKEILYIQKFIFGYFKTDQIYIKERWIIINTKFSFIVSILTSISFLYLLAFKRFSELGTTLIFFAIIISIASSYFNYKLIIKK